MSSALEPRVSDLENMIRELAYAQLRTERSLEELSNEMRAFQREMKAFGDESRRQSQEMNRRWGDLANRLGTVVEDIVAPNIPGIVNRYFGVDDLDLLMVRPRKKHPRRGDRKREFDVIAVRSKFLFVNETKSSLRSDDVKDFAANYQEVLEYFPEYSDRRLVPIMSSLYLTAETIALLTAHGIYAMAMSDDTMKLLNFDEINK